MPCGMSTQVYGARSQAVIYLVPSDTRPTTARYTFMAMGLILCFALQARAGGRVGFAQPHVLYEP